MTGTPHAPWRLRGECVVAWVPPPVRLRALLPEGIRPLPGPAALVGASYTDSPVGPYLELALGLPARLGLRPGLCIVVQVVSAPPARLGYRQNWGLPASLGGLSWSVDGDERVLRCEEPDLELRGTPIGPGVPMVVPFRSVQRRADGPVLLPRRFVALVRVARTLVSTGERIDPSRAGLGGRHAGAVMAGMRIIARPARHPAGFLSSLRAPLRPIEPGIVGQTCGPAFAAALSSPGDGTGQGRPAADYSGDPRGRLAQLVRAQPSHG